MSIACKKYLFVPYVYYATLFKFIKNIIYTYLNFLCWLTSPGMHFSTAPRGNKCLNISHPTVLFTKLFHFFSSFWKQIFLPLDSSFYLLTVNQKSKTSVKNFKAGVSLHVTFSAGEQLILSQVGKTFRTELYKRNFPLDGQTRRPKSSSQPVNLPSARPSMKPLHCVIEFSSLRDYSSSIIL